MSYLTTNDIRLLAPFISAHGTYLIQLGSALTAIAGNNPFNYQREVNRAEAGIRSMEVYGTSPVGPNLYRAYLATLRALAPHINTDVTMNLSPAPLPGEARYQEVGGPEDTLVSKLVAALTTRHASNFRGEVQALANQPGWLALLPFMPVNLILYAERDAKVFSRAGFVWPQSVPQDVASDFLVTMTQPVDPANPRVGSTNPYASPPSSPPATTASRRSENPLVAFPVASDPQRATLVRHSPHAPPDQRVVAIETTRSPVRPSEGSAGTARSVITPGSQPSRPVVVPISQTSNPTVTQVGGSTSSFGEGEVITPVVWPVAGAIARGAVAAGGIALRLGPQLATVFRTGADAFAKLPPHVQFAAYSLLEKLVSNYRPDASKAVIDALKAAGIGATSPGLGSVTVGSVGSRAIRDVDADMRTYAAYAAVHGAPSLAELIDIVIRHGQMKMFDAMYDNQAVARPNHRVCSYCSGYRATDTLLHDSDIFAQPNAFRKGPFFRSDFITASFGDLKPGTHGMIRVKKLPFEITLNRNTLPERSAISFIHEVLHGADQLFKLKLPHSQLHTLATFLFTNVVPGLKAMSARLGRPVVGLDIEES